MIVIPAVDMLDGSVVRLYQGRYEQVTTYSGDPRLQVEAFGQQGAGLVHIVDLAAARSGNMTNGVWEPLVAVGVSIQAGGGIRDPDIASSLLRAGVARIVVGTAAVDPAGPLEEIVAVAGPARLVVGLDVREGRVRGSGWTDEGRPLIEVVHRLVEAGVERVLVTGIISDGTMAGPDVRLLREVRSLAPQLAIIASGGVGTLHHLSGLARDDWEAVIVGRALYEGAFTLEEAMSAAAG